ncbi:hypothetical protein RJ639_024849 [Escallonia herrerae]|uniref:Pentatricopeptide repeat-containing protein n=1 Tax=Escallonia herrerae TaxID=1293975 RepID=A0AA88UY80_9ASTE|nr:hypothetical protein RJ639_024849 [Escallonia herrerae]
MATLNHNSFASTAQVEEASRILRTFVQALDLRHDKAMHTKLVKQALLSSLYLRNNLLNMYAKCSHLPDAFKLFNKMTHKNVVSWTAVIAGFIQKGYPVEALSLSLSLYVQTHALEYQLDEAKKYFSSMTDVYGMHPEEDHYACMANLFGRQGRTKEAKELILKVPFQPELPDHAVLPES